MDLLKLEKKINQIKNYPQYRDKSPEELKQIASELLTKKSRKKSTELQEGEEIFALEEFLDEAEHALAIKKYQQYAEKCTITNEAQRGKVKSIVLLEVQLSALLKEVNEIRKDGNRVLSPNLLSSIRELLTQLDKLKDDVFGVKDDSPFNVLMIMFKKFRYWLSRNQLSREVKCIHCSKPFLLHMRTDKYEAQKHPYLIDQLLGNEEMMNDYLQGKLTCEQMARYLNCYVKYVDWYLEHHFNKNNPLYQIYIDKKKKELEEQQKNG